MTARRISGMLGAWILMFGLSGSWHSFIMADFYSSFLEEAARTEPNLVVVAVGYLTVVLLMAWMYPHGYSGGSPLAEGARFGAVMGLIWILPLSLVLAGLYDLSMTEVAIDSVWHVVEGTVGGSVIGLAHGRATNRLATT